MATFVMSAVTPRIIRIFSILLPTILPTAIPALPFIPAVMLTAASGALVPMAATVSPMITDGILSSFATEEAPSTKKSAPFTRSMKPTIKRIYIIKL